jgi:dihydrolipoamide dehydrogenase
VIGGGVVGIELGSAFAAFGSQVTVIELMDRIVPNMDEEVSALLKKELARKGMKILNSVRLKEIIETAGGVKLVLDDGSAVEADRALLSIGRVPDCAGIAQLGAEMDRGRIVVNERMETTIPHVYAPGDVNGRCMLAHAAFKMGEVAAVNAMGGNTKYMPRQVPSSIYTTPEVGAIGLTEAEAGKSYDIKTGKFPFAANGRALASGEGAGFIKVISEKKYGEILGVHIIGPGAAEMVNEASLMMSMEVTDEEMAGIIHAHPTYSEALMEAAADAAGKCIHLPKK